MKLTTYLSKAETKISSKLRIETGDPTYWVCSLIFPTKRIPNPVVGRIIGIGDSYADALGDWVRRMEYLGWPKPFLDMEWEEE